LLPFAEGRSSIVWTLPDEEAARVLQLDDDTFARELTLASAGVLGDAIPVSKRVAFPLRRQSARTYVSGRVLLLGDAAHVVHPLAGQGVNLGLRDVAALRDAVTDAKSKRADWASPHRLARWARVRRSENSVATWSFDGINQLFSNDEMHLTLLRGPLLGLAGKLPPLTGFLWRKASGL
jgi:2-octaprenyl-3-methyl-6-methoxy-1,4-benzoquinol hydroxylase